MVKGVSKIVLAASLTAILSVCTVPDAHVSKMINCIDCSVVHAAVTRLETPSIVNLENKYEGIEITWNRKKKKQHAMDACSHGCRDWEN